VDMSSSETRPAAKIGTFEVFVAGVALVVASTTLVSDLQGYFALGLSFAVAILLAFGVNLLLGLSVAELAIDRPKAGALYEYGRAIYKGTPGKFIGVFLAFTFIGMFVFAGAGETAAGAFGLQAVFNQSSNLNWYILALTVLAVIPNLFGIKTAAWVSAALLLGMIGIRWFFGLAGFLGFSDAGAWSSANLDTGGPGAFDWFGNTGLLASGLVLAFWTFVGIEFVAPLVEETRMPRRNMTIGIVVGLVVILSTSWVMGIGLGGTTPPGGGTWADIAISETSQCAGSCPQLVVGQEMFGGFGRLLMALASVMATLGSMTVAFAAIPRIIHAIAREGLFFGPLSTPFAKLHPKYGSPVLPLFGFAAVATAAAMLSANVLDWIYAGAYVWLLIYAAYHVLLIANRLVRGTASDRNFLLGRSGYVLGAVGFVVTLATLYYAFLGAHSIFLPKALWVIGVAVVASVVAVLVPGAEPRPRLDLETETPVSPSV
jgi:amino acid transporter